MDWRDRIELNSRILVGKPVIKGTRLAVEFILESLAERWTHEQILKSYPQLTEEDVWAVLSYAVEVDHDPLDEVIGTVEDGPDISLAERHNEMLYGDLPHRPRSVI